MLLPALIAVSVFMVIGFTMWFLTNSEKAKALDDLRLALNATAAEVSQADEERSARSAEIILVGFVEDPNAVYKTVSSPAIAAAIAEARRGANLDAGTDTPTLETLIQPLLDRIAEENAAKDLAAGERDTARSQLESERSSKRTIQSGLEDEKRELETRITDIESSSQAAQDELESQVARLRENVNDLDAQNRELRNEISGLERTALQSTREHVARVNNLKERLRPFDEPLASLPDGEVVSVSDELPLGWIDIGARQRLAVGTSFDVFDGDPGARRFKGRCHVTSTERNRAEVEITDVVDRFDPIVAGDILVNPLYDPNGERNAVLLGRFDGLHSQNDLGVLLEGIGVHVQSDLDLTTDFLIVGGELYTDEEGEPLETPTQPSEMSAYRDAQAAGVVILPISDLRRYFQM